MKSLRAKTILSALLPIALVLVVTAIFALPLYENAARDVVQQRDTELAKISAARLYEGLTRYSQALLSTAAEDDVQSMEPARLSSALEKDRNRLYVFDAGVLVYDSEGVALWSQPSATERQGMGFPLPLEFDKVRRTLRPVFSNVFKDTVSGEDVIAIGVPIMGGGNELKGVLVGMSTLRYSPLGEMYTEVLELTAGHDGFAYLVDGQGRVIYHRDLSQMGRDLTGTVPVVRVTRGEADAVLTQDSTGKTVISGFAPVRGTGWGVITQERWENVVGPIRGYGRLLLGLLLVGGALSGALILLAIGRILKPIKDLTRGAQRIAGGDFEHTITARTGDEIQALAEQFNSMAGTLKESYNVLEQKVEERTRGERRRAEQLRAINEVGRRISAILSLEELLPHVVTSLHDTFNYYDVNIFLLEPGSGDVVLRAGSGGYKGAVPLGLPVKVTEGIVGWVFQTGEPIVANDVSREPRYLFVEELADTRSELAAPIKVGTKTLGVLDIESAEPGAFDEMDLFTVQTLADQVAIATENARLYQETENLLLNLLPADIAERLKAGEENIAESFQQATVMFADIVDFTKFCSNRPPEEVASTLGQILSLSDSLIDKYNLEKIKTQGDCYIVVGGLPQRRDDHAEAIANLALEMREALCTFRAKKGKKLAMRFGIHTGPVSAGVIGKKKFVYDIWGDTVNIASRIETDCSGNLIQVSHSTYQELKDKFPFTARGEIHLKGKGKVKVYYLEGRLPRE